MHDWPLQEVRLRGVLIQDIETRGHLIASSTLVIHGDDVSFYTRGVHRDHSAHHTILTIVDSQAYT